jgi:hypothetical protein
VVVLVAALALAACGKESRSEDRASRPTTAAPVTTSPHQQALRSALLTLAEVQALPDAPDGFAELPSPPFGKLYDADPRGPCGGTITKPPAPDAIVSFGAQPSGVTVYHAVYGMAMGRAEQSIAELRADMRPRCPAFRSRSVAGVHTTQFLGEMLMPPVGDDRLAILWRTRFADTPDAYLTYAVIRAGDDLSVVMVMTFAPIPPDFPVEVVAAAAKKLP